MQYMKQGREMQDKELVNYLLATLNIKENVYVVDDIYEELESINDLNTFKSYCKAQSVKEEYQYLTGFQKFLKIAHSFKEEKEDQLKLVVLDGVEEKVNKLINKCRMAYNAIDEKMPEGYPYEKVSYENIPNYFEKSEINLLEQVGGFKRWFLNMGYDEHQFKKDLIKAVEEARMRFYSKDNLLENKEESKMITLQDIKGKR